MVKFDLGPFLQDQSRIAKLKSAYNSLIIAFRDRSVKPTNRISWAGNILMWSDLILGHSFKVKQG